MATNLMSGVRVWTYINRINRDHSIYAADANPGHI